MKAILIYAAYLTCAICVSLGLKEADLSENAVCYLVLGLCALMWYMTLIVRAIADIK